jgi:hypothetical protein
VSDPPSYPRELERDVILRDGARVSLRPIRPDDAPRLATAYQQLSTQSAYQRFFTVAGAFLPTGLISSRPSTTAAGLPSSPSAQRAGTWNCSA